MSNNSSKEVMRSITPVIESLYGPINRDYFLAKDKSKEEVEMELRSALKKEKMEKYYSPLYISVLEMGDDVLIKL